MTPLRRRTKRAAGAIFATVVAGGAMAAGTTTAGADEDAPLKVQKFEAADFESQAAELPDEMVSAIDRDLDVDAAQYLADAAAGKVAADVLNDLGEDIDIVSSKIDGQELTVYLPKDASNQAIETVKDTGASVELGEPEKADVAVEKRETALADDFRGGYGYGTVWETESGEPDGARCSSAFNGTTGNFLTAGHCGNDLDAGTEWYHIDVEGPILDGDASLSDQVGVNGDMQFGGGNDGGLVDVVDGWTLPAEVAGWGGGTGHPDDGSVKIYDIVDPIQGQPICKSGASSGWTCGEVLEAEEYNPGLEVTSVITNVCVIGGDSGGAMVSGNYALAVDSWSTQAESATDCTNWTPATIFDRFEGSGLYADGDISGGFSVANAEDLFTTAFDLAIHVGQPSLYEEQVVGSTPTISGNVDAAIGADIEVTITGDAIDEPRELKAKVGDDQDSLEGAQEWSVTLDTALPTGDYTYTATATHTAMGSSTPESSDEPATGEFSVVAESLAIESPSDDQVVSASIEGSGNQRPAFTGTGQAGGEVTLTVGEDEFGTASVDDEGNWTIEPDADLPLGERFDATVTQVFEGGEQSQTVSNLGIQVKQVHINQPEDGSEVKPSIAFEGSAYAGSDVEVAVGDADPVAADVDDEGNWTFTPDDELAAGDYTVTATASVEDGDADLTSSEFSLEFTVAETDDGGDGDLPDTGTNNTPFIMLGIGLLVVGGGFVAFRVIRGRSMA